ncbi:GNAT family N-acetyltransferase [Paenibacillus sp. KN14-4R]|uniref:GNAT family N-acetyltransferase n=1 Tax=Paenibacillus sp. KN14-4R TaxID=3445773 RepID=UPI003FA0BC69
MQIRAAQPQDAKQIAHVHVASWRMTYQGIISDDYLANLSVENREKRWESIFANRNPDNQIWVVEDQGTIVGFANCGASRDKDKPFDAEIYAIYFLQEYQGKGLGSALFRRVVQELVKHKFTSLLVWVLEGNSALSFYQKLGGVIVAEKTVIIGDQQVKEFALGWPDLIAVPYKSR